VEKKPGTLVGEKRDLLGNVGRLLVFRKWVGRGNGCSAARAERKNRATQERGGSLLTRKKRK